MEGGDSIRKICLKGLDSLWKQWQELKEIVEKRRKLDFPRKWRPETALNGMRGSYYKEDEVAGAVEKVAILQLTKI